MAFGFTLERIQMLVRKLAAVAVAASVAFGTAGCTFMSPIATQNAYQPGDGTNANLGSSVTGIAIRNFVYLVNASGSGALIGSLVNQSAKDATVTIAAGAESWSTKIPAGAKFDFGYNGASPLNFAQKAAAGTLTVIDFSDDSGNKVELKIPVLDGTFSEYAGLVPTNPTPSTKG
jgi:hypothetical protein